MEKHDLAVFIGRFQPFHTGHLETVRHGLSVAERVLILVGSSEAAPNSKNPFSFDERCSMIRAPLSDEENRLVDMEPIRDHFYSDDVWVAEVQEAVTKHSRHTDSVCLTGRYKDSSSYYLRLFPQWEFSESTSRVTFNATDVRDALFRLEPAWAYMLPKAVQGWIHSNYLPSAKYAHHVEEHKQIQSYKETWKDTPFPVTFVTVDAVVYSKGHVLLVKRKFHPGKGLYALPGGFVKQDERLVDAAVRELREETGIRIAADALKMRVDESKVFDYPGRSLRGRTITHAFSIRIDKVPDGDTGLPEIRAGSDADQVRWVPIAEALASSEKFFEDHHAILSAFLVRG